MASANNSVFVAENILSRCDHEMRGEINVFSLRADICPIGDESRIIVICRRDLPVFGSA